jgi:hypothetical protein
VGGKVEVEELAHEEKTTQVRRVPDETVTEWE